MMGLRGRLARSRLALYVIPMKQMNERDAQFFRPLWLRVLVTGGLAVWFGLEAYFSHVELWMTVTGLAFEMSGPGYSGLIHVLLGIAPDGTLLGVRVRSHTETPGLGDKIELAKDDWILGFTGKSLRDPAPENWKVKRDGGVFDQFSGATITPRAVVRTITRGLTFFDRNKAALTAPLPQKS